MPLYSDLFIVLDIRYLIFESGFIAAVSLALTSTIFSVAESNFPNIKFMTSSEAHC
jgi:hypothetical protein